MYEADGYMCAIEVTPDRPKWGIPSVQLEGSSRGR